MNFTEHEKFIYNFAKRHGFNHEDILDMIQEMYIRAMRYMHNFRGECSIRTWLTYIIRSIMNETRQKLRRKNKNRVEYDLNNASVVYTDILEEKEVRQNVVRRVRKSIAKLDERSKLIIKCYMNEMSNREAARIVNTTESALKSRLHRVKMLLKEDLAHMM